MSISHDDWPTHAAAIRACALTSTEHAASVVDAANAGHVPVGAPKFAKSMDAIVAEAWHVSAILPSARPSSPVAQLHVHAGREAMAR